jgi:uncharacterized protein (TIGR03435 family)
MSCCHRLLNLRRLIVLPIAIVVLVPCGSTQEAARVISSIPQFEVASVKPALQRYGVPTERPSWGQTAPNIRLLHVTLTYVLMHIFELGSEQIRGPDWLSSDYFDIIAVMPNGARKEDVPDMLKALLVQRFRLSCHEEGRSSKAYVLSIAEGGPKLTPPLPAESDPTLLHRGVTKTSDGTISSTGEGAFGPFRLLAGHGVLHYEFSSITMAELSRFLSQGQLDMPVTDATGLSARYRVMIDVPQRTLPGATPPVADGSHGEVDAPVGASIDDSLKKIGLRIDRRSSTIRFLIVDQIQRNPTPN